MYHSHYTYDVDGDFQLPATIIQDTSVVNEDVKTATLVFGAINMSDTISLPIATSTLNNASNQSDDKENNDNISLKVSVGTMKAKTKINTSRIELVRSNDVLAKRLNKTKMESKMLRNKLKKAQADIIKYRQVINYLMHQRGTSRTKIGTFRKNVTSLEELLAASKLECEKLREELDNFSECGQENDIENLSYLANTTLLSDLQKSKAPSADKNSKKVVNMVRPMKCGFVVGNPVVSLKRLRRQPVLVVRPPMPVLSEDSEVEEEESETEDTGTGTNYTSITSDSSRASSPELPIAVRKKPAPKGKNTRQSSASVAARPALIRRDTYVVASNQQASPPIAAKPAANRRETYVVASNQQSSAPSRPSVNRRETYSLSADQQMQLKPCRVIMKDIMSNGAASVAAASMLPVVVLDRVNTSFPNLPKESPVSRESENPRDSVNTEVVPMEITGIMEQPNDKPEGTSKTPAQTLKELMASQKTSLNTINEEETDVSQTTADTTEASPILTPNLNMSNITVRTHSASPNAWATPLENTFVNGVGTENTSTFKSNTPNARRSINFEQDIDSSEDDDVNDSTRTVTHEGNPLSTPEERPNHPDENQSQSNADEECDTSVVSDHEKTAEKVSKVTEEDTSLTADNDTKTSAVDPQMNITYEVPKKPIARKVKAMPMSVKMRKMAKDKNKKVPSDNAESPKENSQDMRLDENLTDDEDKSKDNQKLTERLKSKKQESSDEESQQTTAASSEESESEEEAPKPPAKKARKRIANVMCDSEDEEDNVKKMKLEQLPAVNVKTKPCPASRKKVQQKKAYVPKPRCKKSPSCNTSPCSENQHLDSTSQDSFQSNYSSSSGSMSSVERSAYMQKFMDRVKKEDPMEGTSRSFEAKKKAASKSSSPSKKSLRLHKKMQYAESPLSPKSKKSNWVSGKKGTKSGNKRKAKAAEGKTTKKATKKAEKET
ncbi:hypothetical protein B566_EDAN015696 [Ephemera danica]|nr:hypothetical protein B566_EDAN015696 [Ephemera danica]